MIIIYKEPKNGKIELTTEELEEYLEKARQEGYAEGYSKGYCDGKPTPITYPPTASPSTPMEPWKITWTCNAVAKPNDINL